MFQLLVSPQCVDRLSTGILGLDELLGGGVERNSFTEFYSSSFNVLKLLYHRLILSLVGYGVISVHVQEFSGLDPYLLRSIGRRLGVDWNLVEENFRIARGFKVEDVMALVDAVAHLSVPVVLIFDPFLHGGGPDLSWKIRDLIKGTTVVSINRGSTHPRGGRYHSHTVHALIRMSSLGEVVRVELVKHPSLPSSTTYITMGELMGEWGGQRPLLEWL